MKRNYFWLPLAVCLGLALFPVASAEAQGAIEINPYVGGLFSGTVADADNFKNTAFYGARVSGRVNDHLAIEGNGAFMNHFEFVGTDPDSRAWLWDVNGLLNILPTRLTPYLTVGVGGLRASLEDGGSIFFLLEERNVSVIDLFDEEEPPVEGQRIVRLDDGDTFFSFNYGGGVKANQLVGPVGFRVDVRGRTLPNFFGQQSSWLEASAGVTLSWGD